MFESEIVEVVEMKMPSAVKIIGICVVIMLGLSRMSAYAKTVEIYAGGGSTGGNSVSKYSGGVWTGMSPYFSRVYALAIDASGVLYAGGDNSRLGGKVSRYSGGSWVALPDPSTMTDTVYALAINASGTNLYAGGYTSSGPYGRVSQWTGGPSWTVFTSPSNFSFLTAMDLDASGNLYVGGYTYSGGYAKVAEYPAGSTTPTALPNPSVGWVRDLATDASGHPYAGGSSVYEYYGGQWNALSGLTGFTQVEALLMSGSNLYAGGYYLSGGVYTGKVSVWNGGWTPLTNPTGFTAVYDLAMDSDGKLYAGGSGASGGKVSAWNGSTWSTPGGADPSGISTVYDIELYESGGDGVPEPATVVGVLAAMAMAGYRRMRIRRV